MLYHSREKKCDDNRAGKKLGQDGAKLHPMAIPFAHTSKSHFKSLPRYLQEYCRLGTGGGLYHFRDQIMRGNPWGFFVLHSDVCCDFPVKEMMLFQQRLANRKGFVILGTEVHTYIAQTIESVTTRTSLLGQ